MEIWVGGWTSHNVLRVNWRTGEVIEMFIPANMGGLIEAHDYSFGPDNNFYVASHGTSNVLRYDGETGEFIDEFALRGNGMDRSHSVFWNIDGNLIVSSELGDQVNRYHGVTGDFIDKFVTQGEAGLNGPEAVILGPDGLVYVVAQSNQVLKVDPIVGGVVEAFVTDDPRTPENETGGLSWGHGLRFGPDGDLYVTSSLSNEVLRYNGKTGEFIEEFVPPNNGLLFPVGLDFGPDGHLYVASFSNNLIQKYNGETGDFMGTLTNLAAAGLTGPLLLNFLPGPICKSDLNGDGVVGATDLINMLGAWGPNQGHPADLDVDGAVGTSDLIRLLGSWGECS